MKNIHPEFKKFILTDALNQWKRMTNNIQGICYSTSYTFLLIFQNDFDIEGKLILVNTTVGNDKAKYFFENTYNGKDFLNCLKENKDAKIGNIGSNDLNKFHCIIHFPKTNEVADFSLSTYSWVKVGVTCKDYWEKYDVELLRKKGIITSRDIRDKSKNVLFSVYKPNPEEIVKACDLNISNPSRFPMLEIRAYINNQVRKRKIPIFLEL